MCVLRRVLRARGYCSAAFVPSLKTKGSASNWSFGSFRRKQSIQFCKYSLNTSDDLRTAPEGVGQCLSNCSVQELPREPLIRQVWGRGQSVCISHKFQVASAAVCGPYFEHRCCKKPFSECVGRTFKHI